jgi:hypothetical protein
MEQSEAENSSEDMDEPLISWASQKKTRKLRRVIQEEVTPDRKGLLTKDRLFNLGVG